MANGLIAVISHDCKKTISCTTQNQDKAEISEAACVSDAVILCLDVY
jgi:hypothetical protein